MYCQHAVEKGGKIYLTVKDENTSWKQVEWHGGVEELEKMVLSGELILTRKPVTDLEKRLAEAPERYALAKELRLVRDMEDREEVIATIEQAINWIIKH